MIRVNWKCIWAVIKKEFMDNVRNKWVIAATLVFITLALVVSYFGSASETGETGLREFQASIAGMLEISAIVVPIIALMLGYSAVVAERERGSLDLLLTMPISRTELFVSKLLGLTSVLFLSTFLGFGCAGIVIAIGAGTENWPEYLIFLGGTFLLGLVFLSLAMLLSTGAKKRATAIGGSVLIWFVFAMIFNIINVGAYFASGGTLDDLISGFLPDWYYVAQLLNPTQAYGILTLFAIELGGQFPEFLSPGLAVGVMLVWVFVPLFLSLWCFVRKDI
ncbi:MAG: ABC transporter permease [Thermoplasmata archaeon]